MTYQSTRLRLAEISLGDLDAIHHLHSFPEVDEFNTLGIPSSIDETKEYLTPLIQAQKVTPRKSYFWKIELLEASAFIGIAGMTLSSDKFKRGEIYYKLLPNYWGKGYATEIGRLLIRVGFNDFNLHRIEAGVATENVKSISVLEKIGMAREGLHRKILPIRGEWKDNYHYAIVEGDLKDN
ncbi:MAG: GNAT family N-acetyltransferase [Imperialibacter sp.]|uniref:GNAT family N-acetyltransferase n=1 Tax=Imperialibacter sp. TaxID=2038411 RepID=UPI0032ED7707